MSVDLSIYVGALPTITTDDVRIDVATAADPNTTVTSQLFNPPHPQRTVMFPGLSRINYIFTVRKIDGTDHTTIISQLGQFDVVPDDNSITFKVPFQVLVGTTPGFTAGATSVVLDGTGGKEDWRGFTIHPERIGQGTMKLGVDYTWDSVTGEWDLITTDDSFQDGEYFFVSFDPINGQGSGVTPPPTVLTGLFSDKLIVTGTATLTSADMGKKIIIKGASNSFVVTLPDLTGVTELVPFWIESGIGSHKTVRLQTTSGQTIDWLKGSRTDLKICPNESLVIYKEIVGPDQQWRVHDSDGNFKQVGRIISTYAALADEFNCLELNGADVNINDYSRLYEDFVLHLTNTVSYASWSTGANKYKFSVASGSVFKVPDLRGIYLRNSDGSLATGTFQPDMVGPLAGLQVLDGQGGSSTGRIYISDTTVVGLSGQDQSLKFVNNDDGAGNYRWLKSLNAETRPKSVVIKNYILF